MTERWDRVRAAGFRWRVRAGAVAELERALFARLPDLGEPLAVANLRRGRSFYALASEGGGLFVKRLVPHRYDLGTWARVATGAIRSRREFRHAQRVCSLGLPVADLLALGERHRPFRSYESLLVYRRLPEAARPLAEADLERAPRAARRRVAEALARLAVRFHEAGAFHMDLTQLNVLLEGDATGQFRLFAVDLESVRFGAPDDELLAVASLGKIGEKLRGARPSERLHFLDAYLEARRTHRFERLALWRAVSANRETRLRRVGAEHKPGAVSRRATLDT